MYTFIQRIECLALYTQFYISNEHIFQTISKNIPNSIHSN